MASKNTQESECERKVDEYLDSNSLVRIYRHGELDLDDILKRIHEAREELLEERPAEIAGGSSLLFCFSILGCYEIVKCLWDMGVRAGFCKHSGSTLLHAAVRIHPPNDPNTRDLERSQILNLFLSSEEGKNNSLPIDKKNKCGWTALKLASRLTLERCVEVLLNQGANPCLTDEEGYTPLHNAVANPAIVKMLLNADPSNINAQDSDGCTALFLALERGAVESAMTLLERNADPNIPNKEGIAPLFVAAKMGQMELVRALVKKGSEVNTGGGEQGITALHWAAFKEREDVALFLIESGGDVMARDKVGRTPLSMAAPELATKMRDAAQRHTPSLIDSLSVTPTAMTAEQKAMEACCSGDIHALCTLLQAGVDVNYTSPDTSVSLFHMAANYGQIRVMVFLMHRGAKPQAVDRDGDSILHFACMREVAHGHHVDTIRMLLGTNQFDVNTKNLQGDTPLMIAVRNGFVPRMKLLLKFKADSSIANCKGELPLHRASFNPCNIEVLFHLAELADDLNPQDNNGLTPLMYAVKSNCSPAVKYLLQRGADPNKTDKHCCTPLLMAVTEDNLGICELLLAGGADPNLAGYERKITPFHIAAHKMSSSGNKMVCKILLLYGADIRLQDADGHTPLYYINDPHMVQMIQYAFNTREAISSDLRSARCNGNSTGVCEGDFPCNEIIDPCERMTPCSSHVEDISNMCCTRNSSKSEDTPTPSLADNEYPGVQRSGVKDQCSTSPLADGNTETPSQEDREAATGEEKAKEEREGPGSLERQETFSKLQEAGEEVEGNSVPLDRYRAKQEELMSLSKTLSELKEQLNTLTEEKKMLICRNKSLMNDMARNETLIITRHMHHAVTLSMHALCQSIISSSTNGGRSHDTKSHDPIVNEKSHTMRSKSLDSGTKKSPESTTNGKSYDIPIDTKSHDMLSKSQDKNCCLGNGIVHTNSYGEIPENLSCDSLDKSPDLSHDSRLTNGSPPFAKKMDTDSLARDCIFSIGGEMGITHNPHNPIKLQWWMVEESAYQLSGDISPTTEPPSAGKFFDVRHGTYHHMDVAVRKITCVDKWNWETYLTFFKEVNFLSCLHCPWVVQFLCACFDPSSKTCSIVNEYLHHGSLHSVLHEKQLELEWNTRLDMMRDVSRGMSFLHSHHILHRSLTPKNILVGKHFNAKLNDFGLYETKKKSGFFDDLHKNCHVPQVYLAPEALQDFEFSQETDVYSFGVVMFECATGQKAFADLRCAATVLVMRLMMGARPVFPEDVPARYRTTAEKCWGQDPNLRPSFESVSSELMDMEV